MARKSKRVRAKSKRYDYRSGGRVRLAHGKQDTLVVMAAVVMVVMVVMVVLAIQQILKKSLKKNVVKELQEQVQLLKILQGERFQKGLFLKEKLIKFLKQLKVLNLKLLK